MAAILSNEATDNKLVKESQGCILANLVDRQVYLELTSSKRENVHVTFRFRNASEGVAVDMRIIQYSELFGSYYGSFLILSVLDGISF